MVELGFDPKPSYYRTHALNYYATLPALCPLDYTAVTTPKSQCLTIIKVYSCSHYILAVCQLWFCFACHVLGSRLKEQPLFSGLYPREKSNSRNMILNSQEMCSIHNFLPHSIGLSTSRCHSTQWGLRNRFPYPPVIAGHVATC